MKDRVKEILREHQKYDVDVSKDIGDSRVGRTKYLRIKVEVDDDSVLIQGLGEFNLNEHDIDIDNLGFVTIRKKNATNADCITII